MAAIYQDGKIDGRDVREWHRACQAAVQANRESRILVAQLEERVRELEKTLETALEAHKRQFEDSDYCYMCDCHEHTDNCPAFGDS